MKTYSPKPQDIERRWYVIDASGAVLGRLASQVATILRGKHKPIFAPHADTGDHVIVVNAKDVQLTGGKEAKKFAYRHSGYPGGLTATQYARLLSEKPAYAVEKAVKGMLPKNRLGRAMSRKLQVYAGAEHPHGAQRPQSLQLGEMPAWNGLPQPAAKPQAGAKAKPEPAKPAAKRSAAKRGTAKPPAKPPAKKEPAAKKTSAKRSTAKTTTSKTTTSKTTTAKTTTAKTTTAKTTTAKTTTAKKSPARRAKKEE